MTFETHQLILSAKEREILCSLTHNDREKVLFIAEWNQCRELSLAILVTTKYIAYIKRTASILLEDMRGWHYIGATALRMLDFDVSLETALQIFRAVREPTLKRAAQMWR